MNLVTKPLSSGGARLPGLFTERKVQAGFAFALVCLGVIGIISFLSVNRLREDADETRHTEEVISSVRLLLAHVTDAESSQRGFAIVGEESYLAPYHEAQRNIAADLQSLRQLTADNAAQQRRLDALEPLVAKRMTRLGTMVELQRRQGFGAVQAAIATGAGKQMHDQIRGLAAEMEMAEQGLLQQRQSQEKRSGVIARAIIVGGSVLALGVGAVALFAVGRDFARRRAQLAQAALAGRLGRLGAWAVELPGLGQTWSDEVCAIYEVPPGSAPSVEEGTNYYAPEFRATITQAFETCVRSGTPYDLELQIITATGRRVWVRSIGEAERNAAGVIRRVQGALQDITARKQTEESLRAGQANMAAAQRIAHFGSWELELAPARAVGANPLLWSDEMFRIAGYEPGAVEASSELFFRLVPPAEHESIRQAVATAIRERRQYSVVHRFIRPDGKERLVHEMAQILFDEKTGQPLKIIGTAHDITQQKQSEKALRESEERFSGAFEHAPIGVALVSPDGRWLKVNRALCDLVGYSEAELLTRTFQDITHPEDLESDLENVRRMLAGEIRSYQMEKRYVHRRGHLVTVLLDVSLVRDGRGQPSYFISQIQDITGRKRAEESLRLLSSAVEQSKEAIVITDAALALPGPAILFVNPAFTLMTGYAAEELMGKTPRILQGPRTDKTVLHRLRQNLEQGEVFEGEVINYRKDGGEYCQELQIAPIRNASGKITHFVALQRDITARKQTENALRESNEKFHQLADNITDAFWIRSPDLREVHYISPAFERIWGRSVESLKANPQQWADFILPEDRERVLGAFAALTGDAPSLDIEYRIMRPDGEIRWIRVRGFQVRDAANQLIRHTGIVTDITAWKQAEAGLAQAHKELVAASRQAGMEEVATGVLHNVGNVLNSVNVSATLVVDRLHQSKAANLAKVVALLQEHPADLGDFLTNDPKGQRIPGYLAALADDLAAEHKTNSEELEHLRKNIEHIKDIVAMQQSYARVSGVTERVALAELVEDALRINANVFARHGLEIVREFEVEPTLMIARHKVMQILVNLFRNAKRACDDSGRADKQMTVRITRDEARVRVAVSDNGVGIPAENLARIFAHGFTTSKDGHGFGLHSGALAAAELGGALTVQSDGPGHGATFILELPYKPGTPA